MKKYVCLVAAVWIICGYFNYGYALGHMTYDFPMGNSFLGSIAIGLTGPLGVPAILLADGTKHWRLKPYTTEQRWEAFHSRFPNLGREIFEEDWN